MIEKFNFTRVVTRNLVIDAFQGIRNLFGLRLRGYEKLIRRTLEELTIEMETKYKVKWYRIIINPLTKGSAMIILYGEGELNE